MDLYSKANAKKFSDTRNKPWEGWGRSLRSLQILNPKSEISNKSEDSNDELSSGNEIGTDSESSSEYKAVEFQHKTNNAQRKTHNALRVLDLGCGNGRFGKYVSEKYGDLEINYVGVDNSQELLLIADETLNSKSEILDINDGESLGTDSESGSEYKSAELKIKQLKVDLLNIDLDNKWELSQKLEASSYNLIVAFGLLHHLTSFENRKYLIENAIDLLDEGGILVLTFWMFKENENFMEKHVVEDLSDNNYILSFGRRDDEDSYAERFCHYSNKDEIDKLIDIEGIEVVDRFRSDGFGNEMNEYVVLRKGDSPRG